MTTYSSQAHVSYGDLWTASLHNTLLDNTHALWTNAAQYALPYWSSTTAMGAVSLDAGEVLTGVSSAAPAGAFPPGQDLPVERWVAPMSGLTAAGLELFESSGAGTAKPAKYKMVFSASADSGRMTTFQLLHTVGTPILKVRYHMGGAESSKVARFVAQVACVSDGDASVTAKVFGSANNADETVPSSAGTQGEASITLTNFDSGVKGDDCCIVLWVDDSESTFTSALNVTGVELQYGS